LTATPSLVELLAQNLTVSDSPVFMLKILFHSQPANLSTTFRFRQPSNQK